MIKILEDLTPNRTKNIVKSINKISDRLNLLKENIQAFPDEYDLDTLVDILSQIYDEIGEFNIVVQEENVMWIWGVVRWIIQQKTILL